MDIRYALGHVRKVLRSAEIEKCENWIIIHHFNVDKKKTVCKLSRYFKEISL